MAESRFHIVNVSPEPLIICVEPEAHEVALAYKEEVVVHDPYREHPATLYVGKSRTGESHVSIWPGDGATRVEKNGVNLLEILPQPAAA